MSIIYNILKFLAGIGAFLFGIKMLGETLERVAGRSLRKSILRFTNTKAKSIGFGFFVAAALQSSVASVTMMMSFASIGIISLTQGIGLVLGANIGTVLSELLISFNAFKITEVFAGVTAVGAFMLLLSKKPIVRQIGTCIAGFGLMFVGLGLIGTATEPLKNSAYFIDLMSNLKNPVLLILLGVIFTVLVQSSLGAVAVLMTLASSSSGAAGIVTLYQCAFILLGINVGTTIIALMVSLAGNADSKRVAFAHFFFNVFSMLLVSLTMFFPWIKILNGIKNEALQIVTLNFIIKTSCVICFVPLIKPVEKLLKKLIKPREPAGELAVFNISEDILERPELAIHQLKKANLKLIDLIQEMYLLSKQNFLSDSGEGITSPQKINLARDTLTKAIIKLNEQTARVSANSSSQSEASEIAALFSLYGEITNINHLVYKFYEIGTEFKNFGVSAELVDELNVVFAQLESILQNTKQTLVNLNNGNKSASVMLIVSILESEEEITALKTKLKKKRLTELKKGVEFNDSYGVFMNALNALEEIGERLAGISIRV